MNNTLIRYASKIILLLLIMGCRERDENFYRKRAFQLYSECKPDSAIMYLKMISGPVPEDTSDLLLMIQAMTLSQKYDVCDRFPLIRRYKELSEKNYKSYYYEGLAFAALSVYQGICAGHEFKIEKIRTGPLPTRDDTKLLIAIHCMDQAIALNPNFILAHIARAEFCIKSFYSLDEKVRASIDLSSILSQLDNALKITNPRDSFHLSEIYALKYNLYDSRLDFRNNENDLHEAKEAFKALQTYHPSVWDLQFLSTLEWCTRVRYTYLRGSKEFEDVVNDIKRDIYNAEQKLIQ